MSQWIKCGVGREGRTGAVGGGRGWEAEAAKSVRERTHRHMGVKKKSDRQEVTF